MTVAARACGLLVLACVAWADTAPAADDVEQPFGPDAVLLNRLENEYEPVPFSHAAHARMAQMWDGCTTCHHRTPHPDQDATVDESQQADAGKVPACERCHAINTADAGIERPSLKGAYHRQCLNCHQDWSGENDCEVCHAPRNGDAPGPAPTPGDIIGRMHPPLDPPTVKEFTTRFTPAAGDRVVFRHEEHVGRYGIDCAHCHHRDTCSDCHREGAEPTKPLEPAQSWVNSHGPCMICHQNQACATCHYEQGQSPPPPFDHQTTGQILDDDHAQLACAQCHRAMDFVAPPQCGNGQCHGDRVIALPDDRPGPRVEPAPRAGDNQPQWATLRPRPLRPDHVPIDEALAKTPRPSAIVQTPSAVAPRVPLFEPAAPVEPRPRDSALCVTEECHVVVKAMPYLHAPVGADACDVCHELVDQENHSFKLLRDGKAICTYCHEFNTEAAPVVHEPVQREQCLGCHNPHGGMTHNLLRELSVVATCDRCHDRAIHADAVQHTPVRNGDCTACHGPHAARLPKLLDAAGADLCLTCHQEFGRQLADATFTHKALDEQCERCHDPHGSDQPLSLTEPMPQLCYGCHQQVQEAVVQAAFTHEGAITQERACLNCHTPHGGSLDGLMRDLPRRLCLTCHDQPVQTPDGRTIAAVPQIGEEQLHAHGPILDGQCGGCHQPHGSMNFNLLTQPYSSRSRQSFDAEAYAFCFQCHDANLVVQQSSQQPPATGFYNGDMNLHALHVNDRWGRSCLSCHKRHVSDNVMLVRPSLLFKGWEATMGFRRTETGGFCQAVCHVPLGYDRANPIAYDSAIDKQPPPAARAVPRPPVQLTAVDVHGRSVAVPDDQRVSVVIVLRARDAATDDVLQPLLAAIPDLSQTNTLVVVTGNDAAAAAARVAADDDALAVIVDEGGEISRTLDIHGWPAVLVIDAHGVELARLSGAPISLAIRLHGYLRSTLDDQVGPEVEVTIIDDGSQRPIDQYLALVTQLRHKQQYSRAKQVLVDALKLHPQSTGLRLAMARTLIDLGEADTAMQTLADLPDQVRNTPECELERARALVAMQRWEQAQSLAEDLTHTDVAAGAYLLLGQIHEHAGRWREAAEAYRNAQQP